MSYIRPIGINNIIFVHSRSPTGDSVAIKLYVRVHVEIVDFFLTGFFPDPGIEVVPPPPLPPPCSKALSFKIN